MEVARCKDKSKEKKTRATSTPITGGSRSRGSRRAPVVPSAA